MKQLCLVVDDEPFAQKIIESYIERIPFLEHAATLDNAFDALSYLHQHSVDILFLDINMPELTGLEMLESLSVSPHVILTTAYSEYGAKSYEYNVVDYLLKPIPFERFLKAVNKTMANKISSLNPIYQKSITIKYKNKTINIDPATIIWIEAYGNFCKLYLSTETSYLLWSISLKQAEEELSGNEFLRVHRSSLININHIQRIENDEIYLNQNYSVSIGKSYKQMVINKISN